MTDEQRYKEALEKILIHTEPYRSDQRIYDIANEALNPKPQYETIEVVRYALVDETSGIVHFSTDSKDECHCRMADYPGLLVVIELRGAYQKEVKPKVKRREDITKLNTGVIIPVGAPQTTKIFAEWEEEE